MSERKESAFSDEAIARLHWAAMEYARSLAVQSGATIAQANDAMERVRAFRAVQGTGDI